MLNFLNIKRTGVDFQIFKIFLNQKLTPGKVGVKFIEQI